MKNKHDEIKDLLKASRNLLSNTLVKEDTDRIRNSYGMLTEQDVTKKYDVAKLLFEYNIKNYPLSGNCYDSYGDYFVENGNIDQAIIYFEKALTLSNIPETKKKLKAFKKRK